MTTETQSPDVEKSSENGADEVQVLNRLISTLAPLDGEARIRMLQTLATFFRLQSPILSQPAPRLTGPQLKDVSSTTNSFSDKPDLTPKQFLFEKQPQNDIERVVCLAYYLTHYRNMPEFKTVDISQLNTEAAHPKFSNTSVPVENATVKGYLVPTSKGNKQIGAFGEQLVQALPNRDAVSAVRERLRVRKSRKAKKASPENGEAES